MKLKRTKSILSSALLSLVIISGCGKSPEKEPASPATDRVSEVATTAERQYYINTLNNEKLATISYEANQILVSTSNTQFFGVQKREDKRKYYDQNDKMRYAVKYSEDGFKLRDENEELLWKVKIDENIKIADNEEMNDAYKISRSDESKIKLKKDEEEVGAIRVSADSPFTTVNNKYNVHNFENSLALGILLIEEIPDEQKFMICAELLKRQK